MHTQQELKFQWAAFGKRDGGSLVANVAAVMCEPALADRDLTNAHELKGRYTRSYTHTHTHTERERERETHTHTHTSLHLATET